MSDHRGDRLDAVLRQLPAWTPPMDFSREVIERVSMADLRARSMVPPRLSVVLDAVATGSASVIATWGAALAVVLLSARGFNYVSPVASAYGMVLEQVVSG